MAGIRAQRARETRARLVTTARKLFAEQGFASTSTEEILHLAGVTRGALYHHFTDKTALFEAVCVELHEEAVATIEDATGHDVAPFDALVNGSLAWIDLMAIPEVNRILIVEAPVVLGFARWSELDRLYGFGELLLGVKAARDAGVIRSIGVEELAVLLNGAMNAGVLWAAHDTSNKSMKKVKKAVRALLEGLKVVPV